MGVLRWDFPLLGTGNEQGYTNSGIETFKGKELLENLAREICQNSLDAKNPNVNEPVKVNFELKYVSQKEHALFDDYKDCIQGCKDYWGSRMDDRLKEFVNDAEKMLAEKMIPILVASDYNTTGLEGVNAPEDKDSAWRALAHSDGTSVNKSEDSGGSYGIGKNAPFACTALSMVFYNTYAIDNGRAFQGTSRLATIKINGKKTQGVGHYLYIKDDDNWRPIFKEDNCSFYDTFKRDAYGTDIIIVGFIESDNWVKQMIRAIVSNFFLAIYERKLVVDIQGKIIDASSLPSFIHEFENDSRVEAKVVYEWYQALTAPDDGEPLLNMILEENDVALYLKTDNNYHNQVASFRSSGMRIRIFRPPSFQHFSAIIVIRGNKLNKLLRKTEPVRHNTWDYKRIKNKTEAAQAKSCLKRLETWLREEIRMKYQIIGTKSQDSGEGDYLPDDVDKAEKGQLGDDILRVRQKISKSQFKMGSPGNIQTGTIPGTGSPVPGDIYGNKKRRKKKKGKKVVIGKGDIDGKRTSNTGAPLSAINITAQKSYLVNEEHGIYKVIIKTDQDYPKIRLAFNAVGEDNDEDVLIVQKFTQNSKSKVINDKFIGPIAFQKDAIQEFYVTFENKEKMRLNIITAEVK